MSVHPLSIHPYFHFQTILWVNVNRFSKLGVYIDTVEALLISITTYVFVQKSIFLDWKNDLIKSCDGCIGWVEFHWGHIISQNIISRHIISWYIISYHSNYITENYLRMQLNYPNPRMFSWRNKKNSNTFGLKKASYHRTLSQGILSHGILSHITVNISGCNSVTLIQGWAKASSMVILCSASTSNILHTRSLASGDTDIHCFSLIWKI